jgi:hypothetical protein
MDNLEEYIRKHREEMDRYKPSSRIWRGVRKELKTDNKPGYRWLYIAAMIAVIMGTTLFFFRPAYLLSGKTGGESNYQTMIKTGSEQIDSICSEIKKDLKDNVANQDVIEALIQNYRIKIRLLEDMLELLKENEENPVKSKSHEL